MALAIIDAEARMKEKRGHKIVVIGSSGVGKTTLANIISREMGVAMKATSGPVLEKAGDLAALLTNLEPGDVLFVDEIQVNPSND